jgi:hypothetical protein
MFGLMGLILTPTIASLVTFVLFMKVFDLDVNEARMTSGAMNFLTWVGSLVFRVLVVSQMLIGHGRHQPSYDDGPDFGDDPAAVAPADGFGPGPDGPPGKGPPPADPGDFDEN